MMNRIRDQINRVLGPIRDREVGQRLLGQNRDPGRNRDLVQSQDHGQSQDRDQSQDLVQSQGLGRIRQNRDRVRINPDRVHRPKAIRSNSLSFNKFFSFHY